MELANSIYLAYQLRSYLRAYRTHFQIYPHRHKKVVEIHFLKNLDYWRG